MKNPCLVLLSCLLLATVAPAASDDLVVYPHVPGLAPSEHYQVRVRSASGAGEWQSAFAWETISKSFEGKAEAYFDTLAGWTHTYVNFETAGGVEIEITRVNGEAIRTAAVHPQRKASSCSVIRDLTFENLTIAGKTVGSANFFKTNEFVERLVFSPSAISKP